MVKKSSSGTHIISILDIPTNEFNISIQNNKINQIIKNLKLKGKDLYKEISKLQSQRYIKTNTIKRNYIDKWKNGNRIPVDCFLLVFKLSNKNILKYHKYVTELFLPHSKNSWKIRFPIYLDKNYFIISETIRTEGNLIVGKNINKIQGLSIPNKDIHLLYLIENLITTKLNIDKKSISRILNIVLYFDKDPQIKEILNLDYNKKMHFHHNKGRLFILDSITNYDIKKRYKITFKNKKQEFIKTYIDDNNLLKINSNSKSTGYVTLQIYNSVFARFLNKIFKIDYGIGNQKTYNIDFPFNINNVSKDILKEIINVVISCEGHIKHYKGERAVTIKIASRNYLKKIQRILLKFGIESKILKKSNKNLFILRIGRKTNIIRLNKLIKLYVKYKDIKLKKIAKSYLNNRFTHYEAKRNYLLMLYKHGPIDLKRLSKLTKKNYETLIGSFCRLDKQGFIKKYGKKHTGKGSTPWIYELSNKGKNYLRTN